MRCQDLKLGHHTAFLRYQDAIQTKSRLCRAEKLVVCTPAVQEHQYSRTAMSLLVKLSAQDSCTKLTTSCLSGAG